MFPGYFPPVPVLLDHDSIYVTAVPSVAARGAVDAEQGCSVYFLHLLPLAPF